MVAVVALVVVATVMVVAAGGGGVAARGGAVVALRELMSVAVRRRLSEPRSLRSRFRTGRAVFCRDCGSTHCRRIGRRRRIGRSWCKAGGRQIESVSLTAEWAARRRSLVRWQVAPERLETAAAEAAEAVAMGLETVRGTAVGAVGDITSAPLAARKRSLHRRPPRDACELQCR